MFIKAHPQERGFYHLFISRGFIEVCGPVDDIEEEERHGEYD